MRFINRNAYIMCAIKVNSSDFPMKKKPLLLLLQNTNFCKSAKDAFNLLMRNLVRVVVLDRFLIRFSVLIYPSCQS